MVKAVKDMEFLFCIVALLVCFFTFAFPSQIVWRWNLVGYPCLFAQFSLFFPRHVTLVREPFFLSVARGKVHVGKGSSSEQSAK